MSGAIVSVKLKKLSGFIKKRRKNAKIFQSLFKNEANIITQQETQHSSWFGFSLILTNSMSGHRDSLVDILIKNNIEAIIDDTDENYSSKIKKMNLKKNLKTKKQSLYFLVYLFL